MKDEGLTENAERLGHLFRAEMQKLVDEFAYVKLVVEGPAQRRGDRVAYRRGWFTQDRMELASCCATMACWPNPPTATSSASHRPW